MRLGLSVMYHAKLDILAVCVSFQTCQVYWQMMREWVEESVNGLCCELTLQLLLYNITLGVTILTMNCEATLKSQGRPATRSPLA